MSRVDDALLHLEWARQAERNGDYLRTRVEYLKCVESWKQTNQGSGHEKEFQEATSEYHEFVKRDPVFKKLLEQVIPVIVSNPGVLQKDIPNLMPNIDRGDISYVLYFADLQGKIKRVKKGRTYKLHPPSLLE